MTEDAPVTRVEFERAIGRLQAEIRAGRSAPAATADGALVPIGDVVLRDEFRLFKWFAGLAFAAILAGFGVLYQAIGDLQRGLAEVHRDVGDIRERLVRVETVLAVGIPASRDDASPVGAN